MDITHDIDSLTHFKRNTNEVIERLKTTGRPLVLTVNGKAEIVVQDAASYQAMLDQTDRADEIAGFKQRIESIVRGGGAPREKAASKPRDKATSKPRKKRGRSTRK
jgi:prevent-host-death family protein